MSFSRLVLQAGDGWTVAVVDGSKVTVGGVLNGVLDLAPVHFRPTQSDPELISGPF